MAQTTADRGATPVTQTERAMVADRHLLRLRRQAAGLSTRELADIAGVNKSFIGFLEEGRIQSVQKTVGERIAGALDVDAITRDLAGDLFRTPSTEELDRVTKPFTPGPKVSTRTLVREYRLGGSLRAIATAHGLSIETVRARLVAAGIQIRRRGGH